MSVRAKFSVQSILDFGQSKEVTLTAVYEGPLAPDSENKRFSQASPSGTIKIMIDNPYASKQFEPGQQWYIDFSRADARAS